MLGNWKIKKSFLKGWDFNWKFTYQTGQAFTPIQGYYLEFLQSNQMPISKTIPGGRNSDRYPDYHRLDLGLTKDFKIGKKTKGKIFIQVINAYNRKNIFRYFYSNSNIIGVDDDGDWNWQEDDINGNGVGDYYWDNNGNLIPEPNIDENDENIPQRREFSVFPLIPTIGFSIEL